MKTDKLKSFKAIFIFAVLLALNPFQTRAETISIYDDTFSVSGVPVGATILGVRWGIWNSVTSVFTQAITVNNDGYIDPTGPELSVALNQTTNTTYAQNTPMAIAIYAGTGNASSSQYSTSFAAKAILTDASWITPLYNNNAVMVNYTFTANTQAVLGSFSYNGGTELITLIPEPSSASLFILGLAGLYFPLRKKIGVK